MKANQARNIYCPKIFITAAVRPPTTPARHPGSDRVYGAHFNCFYYKVLSGFMAELNGKLLCDASLFSVYISMS